MPLFTGKKLMLPSDDIVTGWHFPSPNPVSAVPFVVFAGLYALGIKFAFNAVVKS